MGVVDWVVLDSPVSLEEVGSDHAIELRAPAPPEVFDVMAVPQEAGASYLNETFAVLAERVWLSFA